MSSSAHIATRDSKTAAEAVIRGPRTCDDPTCARHSGTSQCSPFPTLRSSGAVFGEAVADAWHGVGGSRLDIPAGIVAALALWPIKSPRAEHAPALASYIAAQPPRVLVRGFAECAASQWNLRPGLVDVARPLFAWTEEDLNSTVLDGVRAVTRAALRHGVLHHTGDTDAAERSRIDLMSWVITSLRHHPSRRSLGEYHTPPNISDLMATMRDLDDTDVVVAQGDWFVEPAAGTGGLFRSTAQNLRRGGRDPADFGWIMLELDPLAAAGAAVNAIVWGLGRRAVVGCGDVLARAGLDQEALAHHRDLVRHWDFLGSLTAFALATRTSDQLLRALTADR